MCKEDGCLAIVLEAVTLSIFLCYLILLIEDLPLVQHKMYSCSLVFTHTAIYLKFSMSPSDFSLHLKLFLLPFEHHLFQDNDL